jgi:hypothetical protein
MHSIPSQFQLLHNLRLSGQILLPALISLFLAEILTSQFDEEDVVTRFGDHKFMVKIFQLIIADIEGEQAEALAAAGFDQGADQ